VHFEDFYGINVGDYWKWLESFGFGTMLLTSM